LTTHDALLAAVLAAPDDDTVRKAFADYCRENGQEERADFIEVQLEIARRCDGFTAPPLSEEMRLKLEEIQPLRDVEKDLFHSFGWPWATDGAPPGWFDDLPAPQGRMCVALSWEYYAEPFPIYTVTRGFVSEIRCTLAEWCGGVCERCDGWTFDTQHDERTGRTDHVACQTCNQTGRTPGIGPAVVRSQPVTSVRLAGVVARSGVPGSPFGAVTRQSCGPLWPLMFGPDVGGRVEGNADRLDRIVSDAAIRWAKDRSKEAELNAKDPANYHFVNHPMYVPVT
jgi:uncharacterized protein (TIGR02996 family)